MYLKLFSNSVNYILYISSLNEAFYGEIAYSNYSIIRLVLHSNYSNSKISIRFSPNVVFKWYCMHT